MFAVLPTAFTSAVGTDVITLSKVEKSAARVGGLGGHRGGVFFDWLADGRRVFLLSAAAVNLPDSSLQVPLIPPIQSILLTAPGGGGQNPCRLPVS